MIVCSEKEPRARHWIAKMAFMSIILIGTSVAVQAKFGPFPSLHPITTDGRSGPIRWRTIIKIPLPGLFS